MPVDVMWGGLLGPGGAGQATHPPLRAMPGLCTAAQEKQGPSASCGARLWQTHATVFAEDAAKAPELATTPTRRLVSHAGVDATAQATVTKALEGGAASSLSNLCCSSLSKSLHRWRRRWPPTARRAAGIYCSTWWCPLISRSRLSSSHRTSTRAQERAKRWCSGGRRRTAGGRLERAPRAATR